MSVTGKWEAVKDLLVVANGWAHLDDYGVPVVSTDILRDLAISLDLGDDKDALREHAKHTKRDCEIMECSKSIPSWWRSKETLR